MNTISAMKVLIFSDLSSFGEHLETLSKAPSRAICFFSRSLITLREKDGDNVGLPCVSVCGKVRLRFGYTMEDVGENVLTDIIIILRFWFPGPFFFEMVTTNLYHCQIMWYFQVGLKGKYCEVGLRLVSVCGLFKMNE